MILLPENLWCLFLHMPSDTEVLQNQNHQLHQDLPSHINKTLPLSEANGFGEKSHGSTRSASDPNFSLSPGSVPCLVVSSFQLEMFGKGTAEKDSLTLGHFNHSPQEIMEIPGILIRERGELCWWRPGRAGWRGMPGALLPCWRWMTSKRCLLQIQR